jgi:hypothetical protein
MPRTFARHPFDTKPERVRMSLSITDESLATAFDPDVLTFGALVGIANRSLSALPKRSYLDPNDPAILVDLQRIACAAAGIFATQDYPAGEQITIAAPNKQTRTVICDGPKPSAAHTVNWHRGLFAALAAREREPTEVLTQVSTDLLRKGQTKSPEWFYLSMVALQAFVRKREDAGEKLLAAMKATDPELAAAPDKHYVLDIAWPVLELAWNALERNTPGFDDAMWKALEGHKHYYPKADGKGDLLGMVALEPLAMAVWAKDLGVTTTVESDYIPRWIIDR